MTAMDQWGSLNLRTALFDPILGSSPRLGLIKRANAAQFRRTRQNRQESELTRGEIARLARHQNSPDKRLRWTSDLAGETGGTRRATISAERGVPRVSMIKRGMTSYDYKPELLSFY